jgi:hypothetical protein
MFDLLDWTILVQDCANISGYVNSHWAILLLLLTIDAQFGFDNKPLRLCLVIRLCMYKDEPI